MKKVVIYTTPTCPFCISAKHLLNKKGIKFEEIDVAGKSALREEMQQKAGGISTVPQIFIDDLHIGGSEELFELDIDGNLDDMLA
jgi:glutaredoxin 3